MEKLDRGQKWSILRPQNLMGRAPFPPWIRSCGGIDFMFPASLLPNRWIRYCQCKPNECHFNATGYSRKNELTCLQRARFSFVHYLQNKIAFFSTTKFSCHFIEGND